jgi:hypothetical protein
MKSLKALIFVSIAATVVAPAYAYERCKSFDSAELKAMTAERLEKAYCWNEDRLLEILEVLRSSKSDEAARDRDACWDALIKLTAQPRFERDGNCPTVVQAGASAGPEEMQQRKRDLVRNLGTAEK